MSSTLGAGLAPAGLYPAGFGSPATATAPGAPPSKVTSLIDPSVRDYTYDANGNRTQCTTAQQRVYLACLTDRDSSCVPGFGRRRAPSTIDDRFQRTREEHYREIFVTLQAEGIATLLSVQIDRVGPSHITETVRWWDLTTQQEQTTTT